MKFIISHLKRLDWKIIFLMTALCLIGFITICSIGWGKNDFSDLEKQLVFFLIGFFLMLVLSLFDWRGFKENPYLILIIYFGCLVLLAGLLIFAPETRGIKGWYRLGFFSFDPMGFTALALIILLSKFFSRRHVEVYKLRHIVLSGIYAAIPFVLIAKQPNLGSALILIAIWMGILIVSGIKLKQFFILILCGCLVFAGAWLFLLKDYQRNRIIGFLNPTTQVLSTNWSQTQSKIAIGSGGLLGQGFSKGSQTQNGFLSEPYTDFAFSAFAEEFGAIGVFALLFFLLLLIWRILKLSINANENFPRIFACGLAIFIFFQAFVNIGMNLGILPVIGLPLPFVSYGGSNLLAMFAGIGIFQSIIANR